MPETKEVIATQTAGERAEQPYGHSREIHKNSLPSRMANAEGDQALEFGKNNTVEETRAEKKAHELREPEELMKEEQAREEEEEEARKAEEELRKKSRK